MKYVPKSISRAVGRTVLKAQKNSPTILFVAGVGGAVAATVMACRATLKLEDILDEHEKELVDVGRLHISNSEFVTEERHIYIRTIGKIGKAYAPAVGVGVCSIVCLSKSHNILMQRNAALTSAYVSLQSFLDGYRSRVREAIGDEREKDIYYAATPVEYAEDTENGTKKVYGSAPTLGTPYAVIWDDQAWNFQDNMEYNHSHIRIQEMMLTDELRSRGYLFLNDVYDKFDIKNTATGQVCGWVVGHSDSDDFVEIAVQSLGPDKRGLMLDFNCAGLVYELLDKIPEKR